MHVFFKKKKTTEPTSNHTFKKTIRGITNMVKDDIEAVIEPVIISFLDY